PCLTSTYGSRLPLRAMFTTAGARLVHRATGRLRCLLPNHPNGTAAPVDEFQSNGTVSQDCRPGMGDFCGVAGRSESDFRDRTGPYRGRLAPTHDPGWGWTEFLDGCLPGRFCRSTLALAGYL